MAVALRAASEGPASGLETAALSALTKLDQVLPAGLRERVGGLRTVTIGLRQTELPPVDLDVLVAAAVACRRPERLRFRYTNADGAGTDRRVEPYRLVYTERRWYLVAYDLDRADWRTFQVDRISEPIATGQPFERTDPPDAAALVAHGVAVAAWPLQARVRIARPPDDVARGVAPTMAVIEPGGKATRPSCASAVTRRGSPTSWPGRRGGARCWSPTRCGPNCDGTGAHGARPRLIRFHGRGGPRSRRTSSWPASPASWPVASTPWPAEGR